MDAPNLFGQTDFVCDTIVSAGHRRIQNMLDEAIAKQR
jgi:hypothetical protein